MSSLSSQSRCRTHILCCCCCYYRFSFPFPFFWKFWHFSYTMFYANHKPPPFFSPPKCNHWLKTYSRMSNFSKKTPPISPIQNWLARSSTVVPPNSYHGINKGWAIAKELNDRPMLLNTTAKQLPFVAQEVTNLTNKQAATKWSINKESCNISILMVFAFYLCGSSVEFCQFRFHL